MGKSTLFNRLIRSQRAITHDRPGVTRDRMEGVVKRQEKPPFIIIDTGGITLESIRGEETSLAQGPEGIRGFAGPEEGARDPLGAGPAGPDDPDAARAGRRGDRRDGVCLGHRGLGL